MASNTMRSSLKRSALAVAMGLCFVGGVQAQTNTAGAVAGKAAAGDTITVTNPSTGFSRTITVDSTGTYRFSQLPTGKYTVTRNGGSPRDVTVSVGTATNADFVSGGSAGSLDTVTVVGSSVVNPIDVSSVESTTILTAEQMKAIPVGNNATAVALLAPGTVRGDAAFGNLASFGGSSVAENQYYVNGFNITNSFRSLNYSQVPFEAIAEQQTLTGGYGAEFGRSTGGVINQVTRRGSNEFHAGGNIYFTPSSLSSEQRNVYKTNGTLRSDNSKDELESARANVWASGALVKDRLFGYAILSYGRTKSETFGSVLSAQNNSGTTKAPNWLVKLDWNINDSNLLEFTSFSDDQDIETRIYANDLGSLTRKGYLGTNFSEAGGRNYILKYTGYLTDSFTLSALGGYGKYSRSQHLVTADGRRVEYSGDLNNPASGCPIITDIRSDAQKALTGNPTYRSLCNLTGGSVDRIDSGDTRKQFRVDGEWQLGDHRLRFGYDRDEYTSVAGQSYEGGRVWRYSYSAALGRDIVREQIVSQGAEVEVKQWAAYLEDSWNITDNFMTYLGVRWDTFENYNGQGEKYVSIERQFAPRLGFSWDVFGDSTFKVFGNAGRYALPLTASVAVRGASASIFTRRNYTFTGIDPVTNAPIGLTPISSLQYVNGEFGEPKTAATIAAQNLDPMYQDEYILGFQKSLTDHTTLGVRGIYRDLKAAIDDNCDYTPIYNQAVAAGLHPVLPNAGFPYCRMFNPGADAVFLTDIEDNGKLTSYTVPGALLSPKAKRTYSALEMFVQGGYDRGFYQVSYTWASSKGNTEGGVKSDIGQADTSVTQDFDYKELMVDAYGYLPNDRRHSLKAFGSFDFTDELSVGASYILQSGRPYNCLGTLPWAAYPNTNLHPYGSSFFRCNNKATPRGTAGRLPWTQTLDLNIAYKPMWAQGLMFKVDVFNVLNSRKVTSVNEVAEDGGTRVVLGQPGAPLDTYLMPASYQAPRSVRFMVQYEF